MSELPAPYEGQENFRTLTAKDIVRILLRQKILILLLVISATGTTAVLTHLEPRIYRSQAKILLKWQNKEVIVLTPQASYSTRRNRSEQLNSEVELIKSFEVAEQTFRLAYQKPTGKLSRRDSAKVFSIKNSIGARALRNADMIQISFDDTRPVRAAKMVNLVIKAYQTFHNNIYADIENFDFLKQQIEINKKKLDELRQKLDHFRVAKEIVSLDAQKNKLMSQLSKVETELFDVSRERFRQETLLKQFQELQGSNDFQGGMPMNAGQADWTNAKKLYSKLVDLRMQRAQLLEQYTEEYEKVKNINQEIASIKSMLAQEIQHLFKIEKTALYALKEEEQLLRKKAQSLRAQLKQLPEVEQQFTNLSRDIQEYEKIHTTLLQKKEEKRLSAAQNMQEFTIKIINPAIVPAKPLRPNVRFNISLAAVLSLLTGVGLAFLLDYSNQSIKTAEEVEQVVGLPVLTTIHDLGRMRLNGSAHRPKRSRKKRPY